VNVRWFEDFFQGIALDLWRQAMPPERTRAEADFLERALRLRPGARVLDVPCGSGRHAIDLASRGFRPTGVDFSREQIEEARRRASAAGLAIEWRQADMRDLPWQGEFDGGFSLGNSFGYLEPAGTRAFLQAVSRTLRPGARFALDYGLAAESILPRIREREWSQIGDILFLEENRYHVADGCVETTYTFVRGGETHTRTGLQWVHTVREIHGFLAEAGLMVESLSGSPEGEPFGVGAPYLLLVAEKRRFRPGESGLSR
jgi:SAM-dependent methyltransferase